MEENVQRRGSISSNLMFDACIGNHFKGIAKSKDPRIVLFHMAIWKVSENKEIRENEKNSLSNWIVCFCGNSSCC